MDRKLNRAVMFQLRRMSEGLCTAWAHMQREGPKGNWGGPRGWIFFWTRKPPRWPCIWMKDVKVHPKPRTHLQECRRILLWPEKIRSLGYIAGETKDTGFVPMWNRQCLKMGPQQNKGT